MTITVDPGLAALFLALATFLAIAILLTKWLDKD